MLHSEPITREFLSTPSKIEQAARRKVHTSPAGDDLNHDGGLVMVCCVCDPANVVGRYQALRYRARCRRSKMLEYSNVRVAEMAWGQLSLKVLPLRIVQRLVDAAD